MLAILQNLSAEGAQPHGRWRPLCSRSADQGILISLPSDGCSTFFTTLSRVHSGLPPGTSRAMLLPFSKICSMCTSWTPSAVTSYSVTSSRTCSTDQGMGLDAALPGFLVS